MLIFYNFVVMITTGIYKPILDTLRAAYAGYCIDRPVKPPVFLLINPNDYTKLIETSPAHIERIYSALIITSPMVPEHTPLFVS